WVTSHLQPDDADRLWHALAPLLSTPRDNDPGWLAHARAGLGAAGLDDARRGPAQRQLSLLVSECRWPDLHDAVARAWPRAPRPPRGGAGLAGPLAPLGAAPPGQARLAAAGPDLGLAPGAGSPATARRTARRRPRGLPGPRRPAGRRAGDGHLGPVGQPRQGEG